MESGSPSKLTRPTPHPANLPPLEGLDLKARYYSDRCYGDFFDGVVIGSRVVFLLTDIAGTRAEAFPIAVEVQKVFRARARELFGASGANESEGIALLARDVNRSLLEAAQGVRFAPAFLGCFNLVLGVLAYHNAGILAVFHDTANSHVVDQGGIPLGLFSHSIYEPAFLAFKPGSKLLLVTKGVADRQRGATTFGSERIGRFLESSGFDSASEICETVLREAYAFGHHAWSRVYDLLHPSQRPNGDDLTAVVLVRPGAQQKPTPKGTS